MPPIRSNTNPTGLGTIDDYVERTSALISDFAGKTSAAKRVFNVIVRRTYNPLLGIRSNGFGRAASEKDPQGHLADVVPRRLAIPARSRGAGPASGCWRRCGSGSIATACCRRRTTGRARTRAAVGEKRSNDCPAANSRPRERGRRSVRDIGCRAVGRVPRELGRCADGRLGAGPAHWSYTAVSRARRRRCCKPCAEVRLIRACTVW